MISEISDRIRNDFKMKDRARESALVTSRDVVRECRTAMFSIHKGEFDNASLLIKSSREQLEKMNLLLEGFPDIYHSGFVEQAQQEFVECTVVYILLHNGADIDSIPEPEELSVEHSAYLNGLGDVSGELRRHILDLIRKDMPEKGEKYLDAMESIHTCLMMFDFPDAMIRGLRHKADSTRSLIERTRGDLTTAVRQQKLERSMREFEQKLS
ncbi:haloacid dehalogenase [Methanolobus sp. ZRKC3]|uniref:haloacid dehalogenase n=1 Tax=Methanolobus sp. ZRKC3 TaxID=3125786 RepID=UPI00324F8CAA